MAECPAALSPEGLLVGLLLDFLGTFGQGMAIYRAVNLAVNPLAFAVPVFSLLWVWLFWRIGVVRPDLLLAGMAVIVVSNVIVTLGDRMCSWLAGCHPPGGRPL